MLRFIPLLLLASVLRIALIPAFLIFALVATGQIDAVLANFAEFQQSLEQVSAALEEVQQ